MSNDGSPPEPRFTSFTLVLPVSNEEARVGRVVEYYRRFAPLIVIDNCSTDGTAEIVRSLGVRLVSLRNAGTTQSAEWFRRVFDLVETEYFVGLSCSEFMPASLLERYDEIARSRSAGVVGASRRSHIAGRYVPRFWDDAGAERFYRKSELDLESILIHGHFAAHDPARVLRLPADDRFLIHHLRDFDAEALMRKMTDYAVIEARERVRRKLPVGGGWLLRSLLAEAVRFLRVPFRHWSMLVLRETWARAVMHSVIFWIAWEERSGETLDSSRSASARLWETLARAQQDPARRPE